MTDGPHPDPDDAVSRLLADARHAEPMPADVAARMDDVLAGLAQGTPADADVDAVPPAPDHPVVRSLTVQRRRRAAGMLVAAAAIVVGGVVVAQQLPSPGNQSGSAESAAGADRTATADGNTGGSRDPVVPGATPEHLADATQAEVRHGRVVVRPQRFTQDAFAARRLIGRKRAAHRSAALRQVEGSCVVAPAHATLVKATYEGAPAVLVFLRPAHTTQVVDLFVCGSRRPVRSATLPLP